MRSTSPIAVIDSGLGGLTVARAIRATLPGEEIVYFGDTARVPWGTKSAATVTGYVRQLIRYLEPFEPKHVVLACNTATAVALHAVRREFPQLRITGVIDPGAKAAAEAAGPGEKPLIGIIATDATIRSQAYEKAIAKRRMQARVLLRATPLLVPLVEEGRSNADPLVKLAIEQYLRPMLARGVEVLVLGCTHYPVLREAIEKVCGKSVRVIDSAQECADDIQRRLKTTGLLNGQSAGGLKCFVTDEPPRFERLAQQFLGEAIEQPTLVSVESLYQTPPDRSLRTSA